MTEAWTHQATYYRRAAERYAADLDAVFVREGAGRRRTWTLDFSETAAEAMYQYETFGAGDLSLSLFSGETLNGYAYGKHLLNLQRDQWKAGLAEGLITKAELLADASLDQAWVREVLPTLSQGPHALLRSPTGRASVRSLGHG